MLARKTWMIISGLVLLASITACGGGGSKRSRVEPSFTVNPVSQSVTEPNIAMFTVTARGNPTPSIQWQVSTDGGTTFNNVTAGGGLTSSTYSTPATTVAMNNWQYRAVATNAAGTANSNAATLTVGALMVAPSITTQPTDQTVVEPNSATFIVAADGVPTPSLQWQVSTDGGASFNDVTTGSGGNSNTYTTEATSVAMNNWQYRVVASNASGDATSSTANLSVDPMPVAPSFSQQPGNQTVTEPDMAMFFVLVDGYPAPSLQWQVSTDGGSTFNDVSNGTGATTNTYATEATTVAMNDWLYRVVATNSEGSANSSNAMLTVDPAIPLPPAPLLTLTPTGVKYFVFSWADVTDETEYKLLENPDGLSGYTEVASISADEEEFVFTATLFDRINASYILQACNGSGCADSNEVFVDSNIVQAVGYFKASNTEVNDDFGYTLSLSGDGLTLAVGAYQEDSNATGVNGDQDDNSLERSGAVYVFKNNAGLWEQEAYVKASNPDDFDEFGFTLALSADGNTLAVGSLLEDSNATGVNGDDSNNGRTTSGAVYVFLRTGSTWSQQAYIKASNPVLGDRFGWSVALGADGNTLAVGTPFESSDTTGVDGDQTNAGASRSGAVYIFGRTGVIWAQTNYIKASNTQTEDRFGSSVSFALNGNLLAVGAYNEDSSATGVDGDESDNSTANSGAVYLFSRSGNSWVQDAYIKASNTGAGDEFGSVVALAEGGGFLAVSAPGEESAATGIDGDQNDNSASDAGAIYVFFNNAGTWIQDAYIKASNTDNNDEFGFNLVLTADGLTLVAGSPFEDGSSVFPDENQNNNSASGSGAAYLFKRDGPVWSQLQYIKSSNAETLDGFGRSMGISADGRTLAIGARGEDSVATGIGGDQTDNTVTQSGAVYLY